MNYFSITSAFMLPGFVICTAISMAQPTLKRKMNVLCLGSWLISPLMAYPAYMERHELPASYLWIDGGMTLVFLLLPFWLYRQASVWQRKIAVMKQRSVKRAAYIESLRYQEDEEPA